MSSVTPFHCSFHVSGVWGVWRRIQRMAACRTPSVLPLWTLLSPPPAPAPPPVALTLTGPTAQSPPPRCRTPPSTPAAALAVGVSMDRRLQLRHRLQLLFSPGWQLWLQRSEHLLPSGWPTPGFCLRVGPCQKTVHALTQLAVEGERMEGQGQGWGHRRLRLWSCRYRVRGTLRGRRWRLPLCPGLGFKRAWRWGAHKKLSARCLKPNAPSEFSVCGVCPSDKVKAPLSVHVTSDTSVSDTHISLQTVESSCVKNTRRKQNITNRMLFVCWGFSSMLCWRKRIQVHQSSLEYFRFMIRFIKLFGCLYL